MEACGVSAATGRHDRPSRPHHEADAFDRGDVREGIAGHGHHVGELALRSPSMRTMAGERGAPPRPSIKRAALTTTIAAGVSATTVTATFAAASAARSSPAAFMAYAFLSAAASPTGFSPARNRSKRADTSFRYVASPPPGGAVSSVVIQPS